MGKEDLSVKSTYNYMNMFNNMFNQPAIQNSSSQAFQLPFLISGMTNTMPFIGFPQLWSSGDNGLMNFIDGFLSNVSKSVEQFEKITATFTISPPPKKSDASSQQNAHTEKIKNSNAIKMLTKEQIEATEQAAKEINCDPNDLLAIMYNESKLQPAMQNQAGSGNVGLIQFGKAAAKDLGTTTEEIAKMSYSDQLKYVVKYYNLVKIIVLEYFL